MSLDKQAVARVLAGVANHEDFKALGRENVLAIKSDAGATHYSPRAKGAPPGVNREARTARYELSNDLQDRSGDVMNIPGIDLKNWQANPVWNFNHDTRGPDSLPVGRVERAVKRTIEERKALLVDVKFHEAEKNPKAELVWRLVADGDMQASSIGFRPLENGAIRPKSEAERKALKLGPYGVYFAKVEVLEGSSVVIPDNPSALAKKLDDLAERGEFSWAVIGEVADSFKHAKGRAFVAMQSKESEVDIIDELEQPKPEEKAAPVAETKSAPPSFDESTLRKIIREEVSEALGAVRVKATETPAATEPTRQADPVGFMRSVLEQVKKPNG